MRSAKVIIMRHILLLHIFAFSLSLSHISTKVGPGDHLICVSYQHVLRSHTHKGSAYTFYVSYQWVLLYTYFCLHHINMCIYKYLCFAFAYILCTSAKVTIAGHINAPEYIQVCIFWFYLGYHHNASDQNVKLSN